MLSYKCFFLSKNACSLRTSECIEKPPHFALTILRPEASLYASRTFWKYFSHLFFSAKKPIRFCNPPYNRVKLVPIWYFKVKKQDLKCFLKAFRAKKRQIGRHFTKKVPAHVWNSNFKWPTLKNGLGFKPQMVQL